MIGFIINHFLEAATENLDLVGFSYGYPDKILGNGEDLYPHLYLEEPIYIKGNLKSPLVKITVNLDILSNYREKGKIYNQVKSEDIGRKIISWINNKDNDKNFRVEDFSFLSLSNYTDDASSGVRLTLDCVALNEIDLCDIETGGELIDNKLLEDIELINPESCNETYTFKLNKIKFD